MSKRSCETNVREPMPEAKGGERTDQKSNRDRQTSERNSLRRPRRQLELPPSLLPRHDSNGPSELRTRNESSIEHVLADLLRVDTGFDRPDARRVARVDDGRRSLLVEVLDPRVRTQTERIAFLRAGVVESDRREESGAVVEDGARRVDGAGRREEGKRDAVKEDFGFDNGDEEGKPRGEGE